MSNLAQVFDAVEILERHNFSKDEAQRLLRSFESVSASKEDLIRTESNLKGGISSVKTELKEEIKEIKMDLGWIKGLGMAIIVSIFVQILATVFSK